MKVAWRYVLIRQHAITSHSRLPASTSTPPKPLSQHSVLPGIYWNISLVSILSLRKKNVGVPHHQLGLSQALNQQPTHHSPSQHPDNRLTDYTRYTSLPLCRVYIALVLHELLQCAVAKHNWRIARSARRKRVQLAFQFRDRNSGNRWCHILAARDGLGRTKRE